MPKLPENKTPTAREYGKGYKLIGKNYVTADLHAKVTGRSKYAEDFRAEGMLFCKLLLSPLPHARVRSIDAREALAMPGVARKRRTAASASLSNICWASPFSGGRTCTVSFPARPCCQLCVARSAISDAPSARAARNAITAITKSSGAAPLSRGRMVLVSLMPENS